MPVTQTDQGFNTLLLLANSSDRPGDLADVDFISEEEQFALYLDAEAFRLTSRETPHPVFNSVRVRFYPDTERGVWFYLTVSAEDRWIESGLALIDDAGNRAEVNRHVSDALLHLARRLARH